MRIALRLLPALAGLLIGCGASPAMAPSPGPAASQEAVVVAATAPADSAPPPLERDFVHVTLPEGVGRLISISGSGAGDVWILTEQGALLHLDGERLVKTYQPEPCFQVGVFEWVGVSAGEEMKLLGQYQDPNGRLLAATFDPVKGVVGPCGESSQFTGLDCPWHHAWGSPEGDGRQCMLWGVRLPDYDPFVPESDRVKLQIATAWAQGDDGWFVANLGEGASQRSEVHRYNGVTWVRVGVIEEGLVFASASLDKAGRGWILVKPAGSEGPATGLLRLDGRRLSTVPVPPSFEAEQVLSAGPDTVWFLGAARKVFEWDGKALHQGEAPFVPTDVWASSSGDLWLLGDKENEVAHTSRVGQ